MKAITLNSTQLIMTGLLGIIIMFIYVIFLLFVQMRIKLFYTNTYNRFANLFLFLKKLLILINFQGIIGYYTSTIHSTIVGIDIGVNYYSKNPESTLHRSFQLLYIHA